MALKRRRSFWSDDSGATLLEMLVVLGIIALLAAVVGPRVVDYLSRAKSQTAGLQADQLRGAAQLFFVDVGRYPSEQEGLSALMSAPGGIEGWSGPYLESREALNDPWGRPFLYESPGREGQPFSVVSFGRDGASGGTGEDTDIVR
ncbi:MAG: type II secretion system major pseudopilin GspG [Pseudomonadota bacterium]